MHQDTTLPRVGLVDEADDLEEELREVLAPVVRDQDLLGGELAAMLEGSGQVGHDVENVLDAISTCRTRPGWWSSWHGRGRGRAGSGQGKPVGWMAQGCRLSWWHCWAALCRTPCGN